MDSSLTVEGADGAALARPSNVKLLEIEAVDRMVSVCALGPLFPKALNEGAADRTVSVGAFCLAAGAGAGGIELDEALTVPPGFNTGFETDGVEGLVDDDEDDTDDDDDAGDALTGAEGFLTVPKSHPPSSLGAALQIAKWRQSTSDQSRK
jgi:hypothetical protein